MSEKAPPPVRVIFFTAKRKDDDSKPPKPVVVANISGGLTKVSYKRADQNVMRGFIPGSQSGSANGYGSTGPAADKNSIAVTQGGSGNAKRVGNADIRNKPATDPATHQEKKTRSEETLLLDESESPSVEQPTETRDKGQVQVGLESVQEKRASVDQKKGEPRSNKTEGLDRSISKFTLDSQPLEILIDKDLAYDFEDVKQIGVVELYELADLEEPLMLNSDANGGLKIVYRTTQTSEALLKRMNAYELPADVAAVMARAFLLAKISSYRLHARDILVDNHKKTTATKSQETPPKRLDRLSNGLAAMAQGLEDFISNTRDASDGNNESPHKVLLALVGGSVLWIVYLALARRDGSSAWLPSPEWIAPFFVALVAVLLLALSGNALSTLKNRLSQGWALLSHSWKQGPRTDQEDGTDQAIQKAGQDLKKDIQNGVFGLALASATSLPGALLVWLAWPMLKYGQHGQAPDAFDIVILILFGVAAFIILLVAGNFQTHSDKTDLGNYEEAKNKLDEILSSLAQTNANVAALNFGHKIVGVVDEIRLRELDDAFQTKEAVVSLESVIRARQRYVHENVAELLERQQRSRRTVLAAGSGMFAGYFTYEVGGSVMKYVDLPAGFDELSYSFWMAMKIPQARSVTETTGTATCELKKLSYPDLSNGASSSIKLQVTPEKCNAAIREIEDVRAEYHKDELMDAGALLIVTLIVSLVTAWIAVRKPEKEQSPT